MKKIVLLVTFAVFVFTVNAQLLVTDSSFNSFDNGATYGLLGVDSSYHAATNCRLAYEYRKVFSAATQQLTNSSYSTYDYYANGNLRQVITQVWNPGTNTYVNASRTTTTYYQSTAKPLMTLSEEWVNNSAWQNSSLQTSTYDANGYLTINIFQTWVVPSGTWVKNEEIDYYNKSNGLADSSINKEFENNAVIHQTKDIYSYIGATSMPFRIVNQARVNSQWQDSSRSTFTYTTGNKTSMIDAEIYSPQTLTWTLFSRNTFVYDANGEIAVLTTNTYFMGFSFVTQIRYKHQSCSTVVVTPGEICGPSGNTSFAAGITGGSYQWQVNTGSGFTNITNNTNYTGATTATLNLSGIPSSWYGYQYRCVVNGQNGSVFTIKFVNKWTGTTNNQWNTATNWSCGTVPDANTDAIINSGTVVLNANGNVRSLTVSPGVNFTANTGFKLTVTH